jgi:hypothetical protein
MAIPILGDLMGVPERQQFIGQQMAHSQQTRRRQMRLLNKWYQARREGLTTGFEAQLSRVKKGAERSAASRGLGKSTIAMALKPTETLTAQREAALGQLKGEWFERKAGIGLVPTHQYGYMSQQAGRAPGAFLGAMAGGAMFGPAGAVVGGLFGGNIF